MAYERVGRDETFFTSRAEAEEGLLILSEADGFLFGDIIPRSTKSFVVESYWLPTYALQNNPPLPIFCIEDREIEAMAFPA